jgi:RND superfamily putative drug exporter
VLESWTYRLLRHRAPIVATWLLISVLGLLAAANLNQYLTSSLTVPGSQSEKANILLAENFGENTEGTFTVVYKYTNATDEQLAALKRSIEEASAVIPGAHIGAQKSLIGTLYTNVTTPYSLVDAAAYTTQLREALVQAGLNGAYVTGPPAIEKDVTPVLARDLERGQIVAVVIALLLLILLLGFTWAVFIPLIFATASISLALGIIYLISQHFLMVLYVPNIVELIGLGLAIDYSLLMVHRYRRELLDNLDQDLALVHTMQTAGRTVVLSGITVSVALSTLLLVPVPFVRSLGIAGVLVPLVSVLAALTLQPVLLSLLGHRVFSGGYKGVMGKKDPLMGLWAQLARWVIPRAKSVFTFSLIALLLAASLVFKLELTPSSLTAIPSNLESGAVLKEITNKIGPGVITPHEIVIDLGAPKLATSTPVDSARLALAGSISMMPEVFMVASGKESQYVDSTGQFIRLYIVGKDAIGDKKTRELVIKIRAQISSATGFPSGTKLYLGGTPAQGVDLIDAIVSSMPWIILIVLLVAFLLLARAFRSIILPIKAILMDLISISISFAVLVVVFKFGFASHLLGTYQLDQIEAWVIIFMFAVLFGLSMDYELFLVSRMREAKDAGATNKDAIIDGIANTSGVVSGAAIILVGALSGFVFGHFAGLQELGIGLAVGIIIDATIIRGLLLPSSMVLLGRWNWWLPQGLADLLKVKASPLEKPEARL